MRRRDFIGMGALAALSAATGGRTYGEEPFAVNGIRIGVQMYSVSELWKSNPAAAFRKLKAMGYDGVQSVILVGIFTNHFFFTPDKINEYDEISQRIKVDILIPTREKDATAAEWRRHAEWLAELGEKFKPYGIRVGYHNHQHEFTEHFEGKRPIEFLYDAGIPLELDVGHAKLAKDDPVAWLNRLKGRVPSIHAKPAGGNVVGAEEDANDWKAIFSAAAAAGTKWAVVECETRRNTYADVEASMNFLKGLK